MRLWAPQLIHYSRLPGLHRLHERRNMSHVACSNGRASGGWCDDWTAALEGPRADQGNAAAWGPLSVPSVVKQPHSSSDAHEASASASTCTDEPGFSGSDPFPAPPRMYYCSAAEQDEWGAVLGALEVAGGSGHVNASGGDGTAAAAAAAATAAATPTFAEAVAAIPAMEPVAASTATSATTASPAAPAQRCRPVTVAQGDGSGGCTGGGGGVMLAAIELGSYCTRAVLHDGRTELVRARAQNVALCFAPCCALCWGVPSLGGPSSLPYAAAGGGSCGGLCCLWTAGWLTVPDSAGTEPATRCRAG
jgi:hypothetical protein